MADWLLFERVADILEAGLHGRWTTQLDAFDTRYWDLNTSAGTLTLHLHWALGISLYQADNGEAGSLSLLESAYDLLLTQLSD